MVRRVLGLALALSLVGAFAGGCGSGDKVEEMKSPESAAGGAGAASEGAAKPSGGAEGAMDAPPGVKTGTP